MIDIETNEYIAQSFVWKDGEYKCQAGDMLCVIGILMDTNKDTNVIDAPEITSYLKDKGYITEHDTMRFSVNEGQVEALQELGNRVSNDVDEALRNIPNEYTLTGICCRSIDKILPCGNPA